MSPLSLNVSVMRTIFNNSELFEKTLAHSNLVKVEIMSRIAVIGGGISG